MFSRGLQGCSEDPWMFIITRSLSVAICGMMMMNEDLGTIPIHLLPLQPHSTLTQLLVTLLQDGGISWVRLRNKRKQGMESSLSNCVSVIHFTFFNSSVSTSWFVLWTDNYQAEKVLKKDDINCTMGNMPYCCRGCRTSSCRLCLLNRICH